MSQIIITSEEPCVDFTKINHEFINCHGRKMSVLEGHRVDFDIEATNADGVTLPFHIFYMNDPRNCGLTAYTGYEMVLGRTFGCSTDESVELEIFMNSEKGIFDEMEMRANASAEEELEQMEEDLEQED